MMQEFEYKRILTRETYERLHNWCRQACGKTERLQINYYYDTPDASCSGSGITVRVRQQGTELRGTIKYHGVGKSPYQSSEENFRTSRLPRCMEFGGRWLSLMGQLVTERICVPVAEGVELALDKNYYLGRVDYELELEFLPEQKPKADAFLDGLEQQFLLGRKGPHKSARFFQALLNEEGGESYADISVRCNPDAAGRTDAAH